MTSSDSFSAFRATIAGRVQGVGFRYNTRMEARRRHLTGWVRNLPDGRVEVVCEGEKKKLSMFAEWLKKGPPGALVREFDFEPIKYTGSYSGFSIEF